MGARIVSISRTGNPVQPESARRHPYADACKAGVRWVRDAFGLVAVATLLAWLVVRFAH